MYASHPALREINQQSSSPSHSTKPPPFSDPESLRNLVQQLPKSNRRILRHLVSLIVILSENPDSKMDIGALCICIGPAIGRKV